MKDKRIGALHVALAAISWSFAGVLGKSLPWNPLTMNGVRSLVAALLLALARGTVRVRVTKGTLLGALGVALTGFLFMTANKLTSAANAIVLQYAMPVFVIAFSWLFYRQKPGARDVVIAAFIVLQYAMPVFVIAFLWIFFHQKPGARDLVIAAFIMLGVVLCSWNGLSAGNRLGDFLAILSAVTFSLVFFCARIPGANPMDYTYLGLLLCAPFSLNALFDPGMAPVPAHWLAALGMGLCLAGGYFFISRSMRRVSPVSAALLANLEPILNPFWVFLFLGEQPGPLTLLGAGIVLASATVYALLPVRAE